MKNLNDAVTQARRTIQRQANQATRARLKGCRWLLVKNREDLSAEEREKLDTMLAAAPELRLCYDLKEGLRDWFNHSPHRGAAEVGLDKWLAAVQAFARTMQNWREPILNYFDGRYSNGFAEGVNLKLRLIHRRAFG